MGVVDDDIAAVRAATDLVAVVGQYTQGKQVGRRWVGLCPFHAEKSPSFSVNQEEGSGTTASAARSRATPSPSCGRSSTSTSSAPSSGSPARPASRSATPTTARATAGEAQPAPRGHGAGRRLVPRAAAHGARRRSRPGYLRSRGLDGDVVRAYRLGWAPAAWDELVRALRLPDDVLVECGLGFQQPQRAVDRRLPRPGAVPDLRRRGAIRSPSAAASCPATTGRSTRTRRRRRSTRRAGSSTPQLAQGEIVNAGSSGEVIVCEGYTDVIGFAQAGVARAVRPAARRSPRSTSSCCPVRQADRARLRRRRRRSGRRRPLRGLGAAATSSRSASPTCPPGTDPGDLAQRIRPLRASVERLAEWRPGATGAKPYLAFRLDRVLAAADLGSVEGRAPAATAGSTCCEHPNELVRDAYLMKLADHCRVDVVAAARPAPHDARPDAGRPPSAAPSTGPAAAAGPTRLEARPWCLLVHRATRWRRGSTDELFVDDRHLAVYLGAARRPTLAPRPGRALGEPTPVAAEVLARVAVEDSEASRPTSAPACSSSRPPNGRAAELEAASRRRPAVSRGGPPPQPRIEGLGQPATPRRPAGPRGPERNGEEREATAATLTDAREKAGNGDDNDRAPPSGRRRGDHDDRGSPSSAR